MNRGKDTKGIGRSKSIACKIIQMKWPWFKRVKRKDEPLVVHCPKCQGIEHDYAGSGLWDGPNDSSGIFFYGTCKRCGSRLAKWDNKPPYVPSDEEWYEYVESLEKLAEGKNSG